MVKTSKKRKEQSHPSLMAWIVVTPILLYRWMISPVLGTHCRFEPSCSQYTQTAILRFGVIKGLWLSVKRILRCHPWTCLGGSWGFDPVPKNNPIHPLRGPSA